LIVAIGSKNQIKIKGTKIAFEKIFNQSVQVISVKPKTSVPPQPMRYVEILIGAIERALFALETVKNADFGVGIEAGFFQHPFTISGYVDVQIAVVVDTDYKMTIGFSPMFEFPTPVIKSLLSREAKEAEEIMIKLSGIDKIGEKMGAIGFLTGNLIDRLELTVICVVMALIPRKNKHLYFDTWPDAREILKNLYCLRRSSLDVFMVSSRLE